MSNLPRLHQTPKAGVLRLNYVYLGRWYAGPGLRAGQLVVDVAYH